MYPHSWEFEFHVRRFSECPNVCIKKTRFPDEKTESRPWCRKQPLLLAGTNENLMSKILHVFVKLNRQVNRDIPQTFLKVLKNSECPK